MKYFIAYFLSVFLAFVPMAQIEAQAEKIDLSRAPEVIFTQKNNNPFYAKIAVGTVLGASSNAKTATLGLVGIGYQANDLLRFDAHLEYRNKHQITANTGSNNHANLTSFDMMANAYIDLATIRNVTPYIGIGAGIAHHSSEISDLLASNAQYSYRNWDFAWALHAGIAWKLNPQLLLDLGYSYSNLGKAPDYYGYNGPTISFDSVKSHDFKIALRYQFQ